MFWEKYFYKGEFSFMFEKYEGSEVIALDTETTGLEPKKDSIVSIAAIKIAGNKIKTSESLYMTIKPMTKLDPKSIEIHQLRHCDLQSAMDLKSALRRLFHFIKNRPLVGYYLDFDMQIINRFSKKFFGFRLPNRVIEVSGLYYDYKQSFIPQGFVDLKFDTILKDLDIPKLRAHNAFDDAVMSALIYLKLQRRKHGKRTGF